MSRVPLISTAKHRFEGRTLMPNDAFTAELRDAEDLIAMNFARRAPTAAVAGTYATIALTAEKIPAAATPAPAVKPKRRYRRRDLKAER